LQDAHRRAQFLALRATQRFREMTPDLPQFRHEKPQIPFVARLLHVCCTFVEPKAGDFERRSATTPGHQGPPCGRSEHIRRSTAIRRPEKRRAESGSLFVSIIN